MSASTVRLIAGRLWASNYLDRLDAPHGTVARFSRWRLGRRVRLEYQRRSYRELFSRAFARG